MAATIAVESLLDTPAGRDEVGTPDEEIVRCECGVLFRRGGGHRHGDEWMEWAEFERNGGGV